MWGPKPSDFITLAVFTALVTLAGAWIIEKVILPLINWGVCG